MDRLMQRRFEVTEWTRFPPQTPSDCFAFLTVWLRLDVHRESQYFYCWYFYTMSVWVVWLGKLTGLIAGIVREAMFCSNKHSAKQAEREGKKQFPPRAYMPTHESHLAALNCRKTIRAKHNNICMRDFCNTFRVSTFLPAEQVLAILKC